MKFKSDIEVQAGLRDSSGSTGASGQILSSNGNTVSWVPAGSSVASDVQNEVKAGVAINKGQAVYVTSADGTNIIVGLASNTTEATSSKTLGLLNATVAINGFADVVQIGRLAGLNTLAATVGDPVWLGSNGNLIYGLINKPYAPLHLVFIGIVTRVNANNGEIFVNVQNGFELNEIHDVDLKTNVPINGDILGYNGTLWVNKTIAGWLGYTPANQAITIATTAPLSGGGDLSANRTLSISQAGAASNGYLSANDWGIFNGKQNALNGTGFVKASGTTISYDNSTYAPTSRTITINGVTQDLSANQTWTIASGVTSFNTRTGAITLTSGDVTTALGYTPVTNARTITINGVAQDLSANRSWTVSSTVTSGFSLVNQGAASNTPSSPTANMGVFVDTYAFIDLATAHPDGGWIDFSKANGTDYAGRIRYNNTSDYLSIAAGSNEQVRIFNSNAEALGSFRAPIFYDSNNTGYYVDPASMSNIGGIVADNWFRVIGQTGLYSQTHGNHIYSRQAKRWGVTGNDAAGSVWLDFFGNHESTYRGSVHADTSNNIGFLANDGGWTIRGVANKNVYVHGNTLYINADNQSSSNIIMQDSDHGDRQIHCNSNRIGFLNQSGGWGSWCEDNGSWINDTSMNSPTFYDSNDTAYYGDFASTSNFRNLLLNNQTSFNTTTPGLTSYGLTFMGGVVDNANGLTWTWGNTNAQAGIYVQSSGAYGTKMYFGTTDSFATGSKTGMSMDHNGTVLVTRSYLQSDSSLRAPIFYDSNNTGYYADFSSTGTSINIAGSLNAATFNKPAILLNSSGTGSAGSAIGMQQVTAEGWTGIFVDFEPNTGWGLYHDNPSNYFLITAETTDGNIGSNTVPSRSSGNRTAYTKFQFQQTDGIGIAGGSWRAPVFYDYNNTGYYVDPASTSRLNTLTLSALASDDGMIENNTGGYFHLGGWGVGRTAATAVLVNTAYRSDYADDAVVSNYSRMDYLMSLRDFPNGTLIQTSIDYSVTNGDPFVLEIKGNSYGNIIPMDIQIQGYIYANTIINTGGYSNGFNVTGIRAINYNGYLCFWFPSQGYWNGYTVKVYRAYDGRQANAVTSITNSGLPTTAKQVDFNPVISLRSDNYRGYSNFSGAVYGTIFYDADNTGYYIDPTAISNINNLQIAGGLQVGSGYASSIDMVDIDHGTRTIHCNSNRIGFLNQSSSWGSWCEDNGSWVNETSMNSPIFYDYNNTGYYVDPSNISNLFEANFGDNSNGNQGINIYYGNQTGGYGKIRFYQAGSNHQTIHSFSANWQGGGFGSGNSANAINIDGAAGVTFGGWNVPDAYIAKGGNFWCRYDVIAYSDARVKDNVEVITNALDKIKKVRGVTFTRNDYEDKEKRHTGVIAQEMLEALPEAVTKDSDGMYSVSYGNLAGLFIEAIKEQQTQIEELKELVNKLINKQ